MHELLAPYHIALTVSALLMLVVLLQNFASVAVSHSKDDGTHVAGTPMGSGPDELTFRLARSFANSLENIPLFVFSIVLAIAFAMEPFVVNLVALVFVAARLGHWGAYAANKRSLRSMCFVLGLFTNIGFVVAVLCKALF